MHVSRNKLNLLILAMNMIEGLYLIYLAVPFGIGFFLSGDVIEMGMGHDGIGWKHDSYLAGAVFGDNICG